MLQEFEDILNKMFPEFKLLEDEDAKENFWSNLNEIQIYHINKEYLLKTGQPEFDYLVCYEPGRLKENETIFDYSTFYEFDQSWWNFQKTESLKTIEKMKKTADLEYTSEIISKAIENYNKKFKEYEIYCTGDWIRLIDNNILIYGQIISAKWYIFDQLENLIDDLIKKNIPWQFKNFDFDKDDWLDKINTNIPEEIYYANGREQELQDLKLKLDEYKHEKLFNIIQEELKHNSEYSGKTFRYDQGYSLDNFDPFTNFIFYDTESLKNVRTKNFLKDFKKNQEDQEKLNKIIKKLEKKTINDFNKIYQENENYHRLKR